jgi:amino acid transporter
LERSEANGLQYCGVLLFTIPFIGHKIYARYVVGEGGMRKPSEIDLYTGKAEVDEYERNNPPPVARNTWEKIWFAIA